MDWKKIKKYVKYSSVQAYVVTNIYDEITGAAAKKKKMDEIKIKREEVITERIRSSKRVDFEEASNAEGEFGGGIQGDNIINVKVGGKSGNSRKMKFEN